MTDTPITSRLPARIAAARVLKGGAGVRYGQIYASRINGQSVFLGWDADVSVSSNSIDLELKPEDAIRLRDWLLIQFPPNEHPVL